MTNRQKVRGDLGLVLFQILQKIPLLLEVRVLILHLLRFLDPLNPWKEKFVLLGHP